MKVASHALFFCCFLTMTGCFMHTRDVVTAEVEYSGDYNIKTKNKYRVVKLCSFFGPYDRDMLSTTGVNDGELPPSVVLRSQTTVNGNQELADKIALEKLQRDLEEALPDVFSQDGLPFELTEGDVNTASDFGSFFCFHVLTFGLVPGKYVKDLKRIYTVTLNDPSGRRDSEFMVKNSTSCIQSGFLPSAAVLSFDEIDEAGSLAVVQTNWNSSFGDERMQARKHNRLKVVAYGIAVKLKELEDAGKIDPATPVASGQRPSPHSAIYKIESFNRESGNEFSYRFILALLDENNRSLQMVRSVQQEFRLAVKSDYAESFPSVDVRSIYVDFPEFKLDNGKIAGRAVVLTISVTSLAYDPNTRTGKLAVKVNANQYEEARKWIRKNIETFARDKNIALVTGEIPPAAKFYLGREELKDGNILEIEFKTE